MTTSRVNRRHPGPDRFDPAPRQGARAAGLPTVLEWVVRAARAAVWSTTSSSPRRWLPVDDPSPEPPRPARRARGAGQRGRRPVALPLGRRRAPLRRGRAADRPTAPARPRGHRPRRVAWLGAPTSTTCRRCSSADPAARHGRRARDRGRAAPGRRRRHRPPPHPRHLGDLHRPRGASTSSASSSPRRRRPADHSRHARGRRPDRGGRRRSPVRSRRRGGPWSACCAAPPRPRGAERRGSSQKRLEEG